MLEWVVQETTMPQYRYTILPVMALLVLAYGAGTHAPAQQINDGGRPMVWDCDHYRLRQEHFLAQRVAPGSLVFLGDSLIERCDWNDLLQRKDIVNRGIAGDTTEGVLSRLPHIISLRPRSVYIMVGCNDLQLGVPVDTASRRFNAIISGLMKGLPDVKIYAMECLPSGKISLNEKIHRYNALAREYALSCGAAYIELNVPMTGHDGLLKKEYSRDGLHLTVDGYRAWKRLLSGFMQ
jgi:hypothetical protein